MKDRIENLEALNERLADARFDMNYNWAETAYEKLAWHFFRTKPFDTEILYKGTCARFDEGIECPLTDEGVEEMKARYTHLFLPRTVSCAHASQKLTQNSLPSHAAEEDVSSVQAHCFRT